MSRRSQRLLSRYCGGEDEGASSGSGSGSGSGGSSRAGGQHPLFQDSPLAARKSGACKEASPSGGRRASKAPSSSHCSESGSGESYGRSSRASSVSRSSVLSDRLDVDSYWSGGDLSVRRRRRRGNSRGGQGSKRKVARESQVTYYLYGSSPGYSSKDGGAGPSEAAQPGSASAAFKSAAGQASSFLRMALAFLAWLFGLLYSGLHAAWSCLSAAASLLDVSVLSKRFSSRKNFWLFVLLLGWLSYGAWYLYPDRFDLFHPAEPFGWAAKGSSGSREVACQAGDATPCLRAEHGVLSTLLALEQRLETVVARYSVLLHTLPLEGAPGAITKEEVHQIVYQALKVYSQDRIGLADYALESGGAQIVSGRCSPTYNTRTALLSLMGIPLWYSSQSPRTILQPDVYPGNCWAFQGAQGFAVVRLSSRIQPTAVTLEHLPKALAPSSSSISSAPKDFVILGLNEDLQTEGAALGQFTYSQDGDPIQTFHFQDNNIVPYQVIELRILSNWGHPEYTCIYRFRVHGKPAN